MTVVDSSVVDYLLGHGPAAGAVARALTDEGDLAAPDVLVFEVLAVLRRAVLRGELTAARAAAAVDDLGDLPLLLYPALTLRRRAWELRNNCTIGDGLFVALAQLLEEPLMTVDRRLAAAARDHAGVTVVAPA
jgi:predicted nucleic acid-binding protein